jgi:hypothetical protein
MKLNKIANEYNGLFLLGEDKPFIISDETPKEEES